MIITEENRYKPIHCQKCGVLIHTFDRTKYRGGNIKKDEIIDVIKRHYLAKHGVWHSEQFYTKDN